MGETPSEEPFDLNAEFEVKSSEETPKSRLPRGIDLVDQIEQYVEYATEEEIREILIDDYGEAPLHLEDLIYEAEGRVRDKNKKIADHQFGRWGCLLFLSLIAIPASNTVPVWFELTIGDVIPATPMVELIVAILAYLLAWIGLLGILGSLFQLAHCSYTSITGRRWWRRMKPDWQELDTPESD